MHQLAFYFLLFVSTFFANLPFINWGIHVLCSSVE
jgi:hypothetical protein